NLAVGIGIQNFPEGLAVSLPLHAAGMKKWRSFWFGQLSGLVEPIFGLIGCIAVTIAEPILPYALAFAAGAMIYVVIEDIIPESRTQKAIQAIEKLSETDLNLLKLRTDSNYELKTICLHHQSVFLKNYEFLQKVCCDPFKKHKTTIKKMLRVVTVEQSRIILYKGFKVKPGQKLCASCRNKLLKIKQIDESNVQNSLNTEDEDHDVEFTPAELLQKRNVIAELHSMKSDVLQ
ncbi:Zinc transporter ZIP11, partial [Araneus ventricosus]